MSFRLKPEERPDKTARYSGLFDKFESSSSSQDSESTASIRDKYQAKLPDGQRIIQRCVIVQKDENGYGLTVSGENPVYVDEIKQGLAADRAGVRAGDLIVKVNGNNVTGSNHKEVVKLIKSAAYVSLTLLSKVTRDNSSSPGGEAPEHAPERSASISGPSSFITGPKQVDDEKIQQLNRDKIQTLKHMLHKARQDYLKTKCEYDVVPSDKIALVLADKAKTVSNIEEQLRVLQPPRPLGHKRSQSDLTGVLAQVKSSDMDDDQNDMTQYESALNLSSAPLDETDNVSLSSGLSISSPLSPKTPSIGSYDSANIRLGGSPPPSLGIITMEDDDFESEDEHQFDDHGHFRSLDTLLKRPAHLSVFLSYLISNHNPSALFFYLITEPYGHGNVKEMRKWAYEIYSTFINDKAPLRLNLDDDLVVGIENVLISKFDREDALRCVFDDVRNVSRAQINQSLVDYCNTRALGLGSLYGDHELDDLNYLDKLGQLRVVDRTLSPHLERFLDKEELTDRNLAMALCIASFMKERGVPRTTSNQKLMDRTGSFTEKDKRMFKFPKGARKVHAIHNHNFESQHYFTSTYCNLCGGILWGVGNQGYQCQICEQNFHKSCLDHLKEYCPGHTQYKPKKDKSKRTSVLEKFVNRKPSNNSPSAIKEAQMLHDAGATSPSAQVTLQVQETLPEDNEVDESSSRVGKLVDRYQKLGKDEDESPPSSDKEKKRSSPVTRSESMKGRTKEKNGSVRRTKSDVTNDEGSVMKAINDQAVASSSSSSLSTKSTSPSVSLEQMNKVIHESDSDFEVESDLPALDTVLSKDVLKKLKPKEKKRQDVINELFYTERSHLRNLKILEQVFYLPWMNDPSLPNKLVLQLLPNISDLVKHHSVVNRAMKIAKPKDGKAFGDIADILLDYFSGEKGEQFKAVCATFCKNHRHALDQLKAKQKKDQKLAQFLLEAEANPLCRRLKLGDLIPMQMQRLTKYRLLVETLLKYTTSSGEYKRLQKVLTAFKDILAHVNQAVKECENAQKLEALQKRMEKRPEIFNDPQAKDLNLTEHKLLHDGLLMLKDGKSKIIDCHVVLLEEILVILQKQDEKMVLKPLSSKAMGALKSDEIVKFSSPVVPLKNLLTRNVATDKKAFFLVSISAESRIYELHAHSVDERDKWFRHISEASDAVNKKLPGGILKVPQPQAKAPAEAVKEEQAEEEEESTGSAEAQEPEQQEVVGEQSPMEQLRSWDKMINNALLDKQRAIAQMLGMPVEGFEHIAEIAGAIDGEKEPREMIVAAIMQVNKLTTLVKEKMQPPPADQEVDPSPTLSPANTIHLPTDVVLDVVNSLNQDLTQLLVVTSDRDKEIESVRRDLQAKTDEMNALREVPGGSRPASYISLGSELSDASDDEGDTCATPQPNEATPRESLSSNTETDGQITPHVMDEEMPFDNSNEQTEKAAVKFDLVGETETDEVDSEDRVEVTHTVVATKDGELLSEEIVVENIENVDIDDEIDDEVVATERSENILVSSPSTVDKDSSYEDCTEENVDDTQDTTADDSTVDSTAVDVPEDTAEETAAESVTDTVPEVDRVEEDIVDDVADSIRVVEDHFTDENELD